MAGDEVVFYYKPNQHVWEFIFKKQLTWNEDESRSSVPAPFLLACVLFFGHAKLSFIETKGLRSSR
ncbi:hypothetical protein JHK82_055124 [Glycine max]|nr:hypothetical protein JHK82_055124 [Glycine max]